MSWLKLSLSTFLIGLSYAWLPVAALANEEEPAPLETGCSFRANPSEFLSAQARSRQDIFARVSKLSRVHRSSTDATPLLRRNFVDEFIFGKLESAGVAPAQLSTDEEFVRRVYLDLTGRIPTANDVRVFLGDASPDKRNLLIDRLLYSPEFVDKWSTWLGDLVQNVEGLSTNARRPQLEGRNALHGYLREAVANMKPVRQIVQELINGRGNNYFPENGPANYVVLGSTAMGPAQDTYDMLLVRTASQFLGMAHYDCLLCHSGRGHLEGISAWAQRTTRASAQRMAAHFSRVRLNNGAPGSTQFNHVLYNSTEVIDATTDQYNLNTNFGNRPNRVQVGTDRSYTPEYRDGSRPGANENWRSFLAGKIVNDPMFARNFATRLWKQMFGLGLVDPVDTLDPDRLDPKNPPAAPWTLQASHPELLERLAQFFLEKDTDMRSFLRLLAESSAYQLSSSYEGEWNLQHVPLFARHYPRRLDGEEVHDAIAKATGVPGRYTWPLINGQTVAQGTALPQSSPVEWAMQLPDPSEPRNNGAVRDFMSNFYRGNRDTAQRLASGSIPQQMSLMNDAFVTNRTKVTASTFLRDLARVTDDGQVVEEMFLTFLSRKPSELELQKAVAHLQRNNTAARRNMAVEDLAWVCINKLDFLFSY